MVIFNLVPLQLDSPFHATVSPPSHSTSHPVFELYVNYSGCSINLYTHEPEIQYPDGRFSFKIKSNNY